MSFPPAVERSLYIFDATILVSIPWPRLCSLFMPLSHVFNSFYGHALHLMPLISGHVGRGQVLLQLLLPLFCLNPRTILISHCVLAVLGSLFDQRWP